MAAQQTIDLQKNTWQHFFDTISSQIQGKGVDISISSIAGDVHQSHLWQLHGVSYDPHDDALIVSCRDQEHVISAPSEIVVQQDGDTITSIHVKKPVGEIETVRFISPTLLA
jgi:hypothetical protein